VASFGRILWRWTAGVFAVLAIGLALLFGVFRIAVSHAPEYRQPIEARASEVIGLPVSIGRLDARLGLDGPEVVFNDVSILSEDGTSTLLEAGTAAISLNVTELVLRWRVGWDKVTLEGIELDMGREADGTIRLLGRRLDEFPRDPDRPLPTGEFRVLDSRLVFTDAAVGEKPAEPVVWDLDDVNISLINRRDGLRVSGDFLPPPEAGERVVFWANQLEREDGWRAYAASQALDFAALGRVRELAGLVPAGGRAEIRAWLDGTGKVPTAASIEFDLADVALPAVETVAAHPGVPVVPSEPTVAYRRLAGRAEWDRTNNGWEARIENLDLQRDDRTWRARQVVASSRLEPINGRRQVNLSADFLKLDDLQPLVSRLPGEALRGQIDDLAPTGELRELEVEVESSSEDGTARHQVTVRADLREVSVRPSGKIPGISGLSGRLRSDARGGRFELEGGALEAEFPRLFRQPLAFNRAEGLLLWNAGADGLILIGDGLDLQTADLGLEAGFRIRLADEEQPGSIDLRGKLTNVEVNRAGPYLPVGIIPPKVVGWLDGALVAGSVEQADVRIEGPLRGFPYRDDQGQFEVSFTTTGFDLNYANGWPAAESLTADILFQNEGLSAAIRSGRLHGLDVDEIRVELPDLKLGQLSVKGGLNGPLPEIHGYLMKSPPIRGALDPALSELQIEQGDASLEANLQLPLKDLASRSVEVDVDIKDGILRYADVFDRLTDIEGRLTVKNTDAYAEGLTGKVLDQPIRFDVAPYRDLGVRANMRIDTTGDALIEGLGLPLKRYVSGRTIVTGFLQFPRPGSGNRFWMRYESDLDGLALTLPSPLSKPANLATSFAVEARFPEEGRQDWYMQLGDRMSARMSASTANDQFRFLNATVQGGSLDAQPHGGSGLMVQGHFDEVSVDEWLAVNFTDESTAAGGVPFEEFFTGVDVHVDDLAIIGQHVAGATVQMTEADQAWQIVVDSETVDGTVIVPWDLAGRDRPIVIRMARLRLFDEERDGGGDPVDPNTVPPLEIQVDDFQAFGINLGRVETRVEPLPDGFDVPAIDASGASFVLTGRMRSQLGGEVDRTTLFVEVDSTDLEQTLEFAGFAPSVDTSKARFETDLAWQGGLIPDILAQAEGTARLQLGSGSLTEVKPGAGRVFGLLSVQALPRRLMLDFRDVFKKGFFFDEFGGDFRIANGRAETDNLKMKGRAADIGIIGAVDLVDRQYDQTAVVSAQIGNTLPVVGAIAAGPIIGGGLFVLKEILKEPLREAGQVQYRITGPWEDPIVAKVTDGGGTGTQVSRSDDEPESGGG
jgi:uncharacterized protein (TIGR02099 family)